VAERREGPGIAEAGDPAKALAEVVDDWNAKRIVLCGMAGARNGFHEAPYVSCPAGAADWRSRVAVCDWRETAVAIAPGFITSDDRFDVMRGEETQIFGAMVQNPRLATGRQCVVLPGTHSKWVRLSEGRIESFRTFMTGELFDLLQRSSLFAAGGADAEADQKSGFEHGLDREGPVSSLLFEARSGQLVGGKSAGWASGFVSGVLIGAEVAAMEPEKNVTILAEPALAARYSRALGRRGLLPACLDAEECTIAGLRLLDADA